MDPEEVDQNDRNFARGIMQQRNDRNEKIPTEILPPSKPKGMKGFKAAGRKVGGTGGFNWSKDNPGKQKTVVNTVVSNLATTLHFTRVLLQPMNQAQESQ